MQLAYSPKKLTTHNSSALAIGTMEENDLGKVTMLKVVLRAKIEFQVK